MVDQLLARRDGQGEPEVAAGAQQGREDRARVGDEGDGPGREGVALDVADGPEPVTHVDEAHAAAAAQGHARRRAMAATRSRRAPCPVGSGGSDRLPNTTAERSPRAAARASSLLDGGVGDAQEHQVDRAVDVVEAATQRMTGTASIARVDQVELDVRPSCGHLGDQPLAEAARSRAGARPPPPPGLEHGAHRWRRRRGAALDRRAHARSGATAQTAGARPAGAGRRAPPGPPATRGSRTRRRRRGWPSRRCRGP